MIIESKQYQREQRTDYQAYDCVPKALETNIDINDKIRIIVKNFSKWLCLLIQKGHTRAKKTQLYVFPSSLKCVSFKLQTTALGTLWLSNKLNQLNIITKFLATTYRNSQTVSYISYLLRLISNYLSWNYQRNFKKRRSLPLSQRRRSPRQRYCQTCDAHLKTF